MHFLAIFVRSEIANLEKESEEIGKVLRLAKSDRNVSADGRDIDKLLTLIDKLDDYKTQCVREEREIKELDSEVDVVECLKTKKNAYVRLHSYRLAWVVYIPVDV